MRQDEMKWDDMKEGADLWVIGLQMECENIWVENEIITGKYARGKEGGSQDRSQ